MKITILIIIFIALSMPLMGMEKSKKKQKTSYSSDEKSWKGSFKKKKATSMLDGLSSSGSIATDSSDIVEDTIEIDTLALANQFFGIEHTGEELHFKALQEKVEELKMKSPESYKNIAQIIENNKKGKISYSDFFLVDNAMKISFAKPINEAWKDRLLEKELKIKKLKLHGIFICGTCSLCSFVSIVSVISTLLPIVLACYT